MDFKCLKYFQMVVEEGVISLAARRVPLAQPALSRQLQLLEDEVGTTLLIRSRHGIRLTAAGEAFYRDTRRLLGEFEQSKRNARRIADGQFGQLRLGVTVMHLWVPQIIGLLNRFRERYPEVTLKVESLLSGPQIEAIRHGRLDAGMLFFRQKTIIACVAIAFMKIISYWSPVPPHVWRITLRSFLLSLTTKISFGLTEVLPRSITTS